MTKKVSNKVCCAGEKHCKKPLIPLFARDECEHCEKQCHEECGEILDVPNKFDWGAPGYYCQLCISILPRYLYPKMPKNGKPRNCHHDWLSIPIREMLSKHPKYQFPTFMKRQVEKWEKKCQKMKKKGRQVNLKKG